MVKEDFKVSTGDVNELVSKKCSDLDSYNLADNKLVRLKSKRAQLTVFVVVAVLLIAGVSVFYLFSCNKSDPLCRPRIDPIINPDLNKVMNAISYCMKTDSQEALKTIGIQGGYYQEPKLSDNLGWAFIPYYYYEGQILMPAKEEIENQLSMYVDDKFPKCLDDYGIKNPNVQYSSSKTITTIRKGEVIFKIDMPVAVTRDTKTTTIEVKDHPMIYNSSLFDIIEVADYITKSHKENDSMVCINCLVQMAKERTLYVDILNYPRGKTTALVMISENYTSPQPYLFEFLNKY